MRRNSTKPRQQPSSASGVAGAASVSSGFSSLSSVKMVSTRLMSSSSSMSSSAVAEENILDGSAMVLDQQQQHQLQPPNQPSPTQHQFSSVITRLAVARNYDQQVTGIFPVAGGSSTTTSSATTQMPQSQPVTVITRLAVARQAVPSSSRLAKVTCNNNHNGTSSNNIVEEVVEPTHVLDLPQEILCKIFSYLDFKEVGQIRLVSKRFNEICGYILNSTFSQLTNKMNTRFQRVKASMPRRESARRNHPLACECDIIETCHMRLSLLQMTFGKHIERKHCYFFPGAILDEIYRILRYIKDNSPNLARPFQVTDELFDLSTMAMEYFKDKLEPILPEIVRKDDFFEPRDTNKKVFLSNLQTFELNDDNSSNNPPQTNMVLRKGIRKIKQGMKMYNNQLSVLRNEMRTCKRKSSEQSKQITEQQKVLAEQQKQILEYANRLDENDKKNEEISRKFSTLLQELNKCKTELQYWRSKSPATKCGSCGQRIPVAPPEVYQALLNQGINPDILDPIEDDEEIEISNGNINNADNGDEGVSSDSGEANLSTTSFDSGIGCSSSNNSTFEFVLPDENTTAKLMAVNSAKKRHHSNNQQQQQAQAEDDCYSECGNNCPSDLIGNGAGSSSGGGGGCPPSKFYSKASTSSAAGSVDDSSATFSINNNTNVNNSVEPQSHQSSATTADVISLNCIASNETKKARRVQKGNSGSSSSATNGIFSGAVASSSGRSSKRK